MRIAATRRSLFVMVEKWTDAKMSKELGITTPSYFIKSTFYLSGIITGSHFASPRQEETLTFLGEPASPFCATCSFSASPPSIVHLGIVLLLLALHQPLADSI